MSVHRSNHLSICRDSYDGFFQKLMDKAYFHYKPDDGNPVPEPLAHAAELVRSADCYMIVSPEYNHAAPPALSNMMNYFGSSMYGFKPAAITTYSAGMWGGVRAGNALRPMLTEMGCLPVSACAQINWAWKACMLHVCCTLHICCMYSASMFCVCCTYVLCMLHVC